MSLRLFVGSPDSTGGGWVSGAEWALPAGAARHAQVRRVQPGDLLHLFDGSGPEWQAEVLTMGRSEVRVRIGQPQPAAAELPVHVTLALGMPANERMDAVVEKATELGARAIQPLHTERSVLRLNAERAEKKRAHWQAIAEAACEQCGRGTVPQVLPVRNLGDWLGRLGAPSAGAGPQAETESAALRLILSLQPDALPLPQRVAAGSATALPLRRVITLNGPEGGLSPDEEASARRQGFLPTSLGSRVLRADTAPLSLMAWLGWAG